MTLEEAKEVLRIDTTDNDALIASLLEALPGYIETQTGMPEDKQEAEPMCKTVSGFILLQWYYADHADDVKLQRTIDSLLKCITLQAKVVGSGFFAFDAKNKTIEEDGYNAYRVDYEELSDSADTDTFYYNVTGETIEK